MSEKGYTGNLSVAPRPYLNHGTLTSPEFDSGSISFHTIDGVGKNSWLTNGITIRKMEQKLSTDMANLLHCTQSQTCKELKPFKYLEEKCKVGCEGDVANLSEYNPYGFKFLDLLRADQNPDESPAYKRGRLVNTIDGAIFSEKESYSNVYYDEQVKVLDSNDSNVTNDNSDSGGKQDGVLPKQ